jgi:L-rhamnose mutarotase
MKTMRLMALLLPAAMMLCSCTTPPPQRYGMVVGVKKEKLELYRQLHANPWQGVLDQLDRSKIRNYSIWLVEHAPDEFLLFGYFDYTGDDFDADMAAMGEDAETQRWWKETAPSQTPILTAQPGQQWVMMEELFYHDAGHCDAPLMPPPPGFEAGQSK